jgi:predicted nucleotidyltransferase
METGLSQKTLHQVVDVLKQFPEIKEAIIYGSRAKGNFRPSSDIDITLKGNNLNLSVMSKLDMLIDDLLLPYKFDISIYHQIDNKELLAHIERVGRTLYQSEAV